jgi:hypothetical protein
LERKSRAQGLGHADRLLDGKGDRNQPRLRQTAGPHGISLDHPITQLASVSGPPLDQRSAPHSFHSTPRHLSESAAVGNQGSAHTKGLGLSSSGGPGMYGF